LRQHQDPVRHGVADAGEGLIRVARMEHRPSAGLGLKPQHYEAAEAACADGLWFEVHPENYFVAGGPRLAWLDAIRSRHAVALHGVALSLAADVDPDPAHLDRLAALAERIEPCMISEHLAWSQWGGSYRPDLLPFPRTTQALSRIAANISRVQERLHQRIALENPTHYLHIEGHEWAEVDFLCELAHRTGCGLLLDINNVFVSAHNLGTSAEEYLDAFPAVLIDEIHLAGHSVDLAPDTQLLIDSHDAPVAGAVWALYEGLIARIGPRPTLIERDDRIPDFDTLMAERAQADALLNAAARRATQAQTALA